MPSTIKPISEIIDELWDTREVLIQVRDDLVVRATLGLEPEGWIDILLETLDTSRQIGYINLTRQNRQFYQILYHEEVPHHGFDASNVGIRVNPEFTHQGFGIALLSLGVGICQKEFKAMKSGSPFEVVATGIKGMEETFYKHFGFEIDPVYKSGSYKHSDYVPEIKIKRPIRN